MDRDKLNFWSISNLIFTACVSCKVQIRNKPKTSYRNPFLKIKCRLQPKPTFLEPYNTQRCVLSVSSPMDLLLPDRKLTKHTPVQWHKYIWQVSSWYSTATSLTDHTVFTNLELLLLLLELLLLLDFFLPKLATSS